MAIPPQVAELVLAVGRMFYREEYAALLNFLTQGPLPETALESLGLQERQVRRILTDLEAEHLVCCEEVTERRLKSGQGGPATEEELRALLHGRKSEYAQGPLTLTRTNGSFDSCIVNELCKLELPDEGS